MNKGCVPYFAKTMDVARFVVSTKNVIMNRSSRDMEMRASYVSSLHKDWNHEIVTF